MTVSNQSGLVVPNASVHVTPQDAPAGGAGAKPVMTGGTGIAVLDSFPRRPLHDRRGVPRVRDRRRARRARARRQQRQAPRHPADSARGGRPHRQPRPAELGPRPERQRVRSVLTREQIDALPDDPEEMEAVLKAMSPPGSVIPLMRLLREKAWDLPTLPVSKQG